MDRSVFDNILKIDIHSGRLDHIFTVKLEMLSLFWYLSKTQFLPVATHDVFIAHFLKAGELSTDISEENGISDNWAWRSRKGTNLVKPNMTSG